MVRCLVDIPSAMENCQVIERFKQQSDVNELVV